MPVAFHLLTHRDPAQIRRLLRALWSPENTYVLHHDHRRPASEHAEIAEIAQEFPGLILQKPQPVLWGRYSLYAAQHEGLRLALASARPWSHWVNLSGQCYPLHSAATIAQKLAATPDASFVRHFRPLSEGDWGPQAATRLTRRYIDSPALEWWLRLPGMGRRLRRIFGGENSLPCLPGIKRSLPTDFTWFGGDNWVVLSRRDAEHLIHSPDAARQIAELRHSAFPEESICQTVVLNGPHAVSTQNTHLRSINWRDGLASPTIYHENDFPALTSAADNGALFARKFDLARHPKVFDLIDAQLLSRASPS